MRVTPPPPLKIEVGLLTGGRDRHYALGLAMALVSQDVSLDVLGNDEVDCPELHATPRLTFLNLGGHHQQATGLAKKLLKVLTYYTRLIRYAPIAAPRLFHILWNYRFESFDRTLLMLYYKLLGKTIVLTAHNVNAGKRDSCDTAFNRLTLSIQYRLADHIFVHTERMKTELLEQFRLHERAITVIPYGINNAVPHTQLTPIDAKRRLGITPGERTILFFGNIAPYKGLDLLADAFRRIAAGDHAYRLIIAGRPKRGCEQYFHKIQRALSVGVNPDSIIQAIRHIPDNDIELYFKAGDLLVLPYTRIFQSGVLFLGASFGLPVVAADVGSFRDEIVEGRTGFLFKPGDPGALATTMETYFESELFRCLNSRRADIRNYTQARHSWDTVSAMTRRVYAELLGTQLRDP